MMSAFLALWLVAGFVGSQIFNFYTAYIKEEKPHVGVLWSIAQYYKRRPTANEALMTVVFTVLGLWSLLMSIPAVFIILVLSAKRLFSRV